MDKVVRAVDVGYGNTKYVTGVEGNTLRCAHFGSSAPVCASHEAREALGGKAPDGRHRDRGFHV